VFIFNITQDVSCKKPVESMPSCGSVSTQN